MSAMEFVLSELCDRVMTARAGRRPLCVRGGGTKSFYGNPGAQAPELLELGAYRGIVNYQPSELVVTARAGTPMPLASDTQSSAGRSMFSMSSARRPGSPAPTPSNSARRI